MNNFYDKVDIDGGCITLTLDHDDYSKQMLLFYAQIIEEERPNLSASIRSWLSQYDSDNTLYIPMVYCDFQEKYLTVNSIKYDDDGDVTQVTALDEYGDYTDYSGDDVEICVNEW